MDDLIRVLHIDESPTDRDLVFNTLEENCSGFKVDQAANIEEASKFLSDFEYDLVLSEFNTESLPGLQVIDWVQRKYPDLPVFIFTGTGSELVAVEAIKTGAIDYLNKTPDHIRQLPLKLQAAIDYSSSIRDNKKNHQLTRLQSLFEDSPVPIWEEEFKDLYAYLEELKANGVDDLKSYFETNPEALNICAKKIKILDVNKAAVDLHKARDKEHLIKNLEKTFTEKSYAVFKDEILALASGQMEFEAEGEVITLEGETLFIFIRLTMHFEENGSCRALLATTDITQHKAHEENLERLMFAIEATRESVVITDSLGLIQYVNPAFENNSGYKREEAIGQNPNILKSGKHDAEFFEEMWATLVKGENWSGRIINRHKKGHFFTEEVSISPVRNTQGKTVSYVGVKRDVSSEILLEAQLRQAQKMESIGLLAGGVAHDFNNMLSVIVGNSELALLELDPDHPILPLLKGIKSAADRSANLTNQLLAFARKQTIMPVVLDLNDAVEGILKMLRRLIGEDIDLAWLPGSTAPLVKMDPSQIDQVLANLCVNSRDAIDGVGRVTVETSLVVLDEEYCLHNPGFVPGKYVMLAVGDNGKGMEESHLDRIFEPFFSTKDQSQGTGLGLATVYGIIKQNGGFINAYSELGEGTIIRVYLPEVVGESIKELEKEPDSPVPGGNETILVVEDEEAILELASRILIGQGYRVWSVDNPLAAIKMVEDHPGEVDLLLTDVILPKMSGKDLLRALHCLSPDLKHMFMSGYTANIIAEHGVLDEGVAFLEKPFSKRDLEKMVRDVLDKK